MKFANWPIYFQGGLIAMASAEVLEEYTEADLWKTVLNTDKIDKKIVCNHTEEAKTKKRRRKKKIGMIILFI